MNILKSGLKISISLLSLIYTISCTTTELISYSKEYITESENSAEEYELVVISVTDIEDVKYTDEYKQVIYTSYSEELYMPIPEFYPLERPHYNSGYTSYSVDEFRLTPLVFVKLNKPSVEVTTPVKPKPKPNKIITVKTEPVETTKIEETVKLPDPIVKPKLVESPVKKVAVVKKVEEPVSEPTPIKYIELGDMEVVIKKSFTVEMDQSGWLFEKSLDDIRFKNKFYTNSSVLFEFVGDKVGEYTLEFSKYRGEEVLYSKIKISVVETESLKEVFKTTDNGVVITPVEVTEYLTERELLEKDLLNINNHNNPDEVYFKLAEIYYDEGLLRKSKEFYEYIYDNYPFSIYYTQAEERMSYIVNNFLKVR